MHQQQTAFENIVGQAEIAHNDRFLLFPRCFLLNQIIVCISSLGLSTCRGQAQNNKFVVCKVENLVEKGENAGYQHFLLFQQCFQKASTSRKAKSIIMC